MFKVTGDPEPRSPDFRASGLFCFPTLRSSANCHPPTPPPSWSLTSFFSTLAVFVSNCYCDTSPQAEWIKTTQTYCLTFLKTEVCNRCCRAKIKAWKGRVPFCRAQRRVCSLSQLLDTARFPWLVAPSIIKASTGQLGLSHSVSSL